jgi:hypothetical protein
MGDTVDDQLVSGNLTDGSEQFVLQHGDIIDSIIPNQLMSSGGDDNDDDDDWSRQVETDETTTLGFIHEDSFRMESVIEIHDPTIAGVSTSIENIPQPVQPELTLKEKLVLRERQRRIETERARLKRQFALSGTSDTDNDDNPDSDSVLTLTAERLNGGVIPEVDTFQSIQEGSIAEESTKAHPDHESMSQKMDESGLGFNMERFLSNTTPFNSNVDTVLAISEAVEHVTSVPDPGVLMERFLNDPIIVQPVLDVGVARHELGQLGSTVSSELVGSMDNIRTALETHRSVSFDITSPPVQPISSFGYETGNNNSIVSSNSAHGEPTELDYSHVVEVDAMLSPSMDAQECTSNASDGIVFEEPRVLRLTEADMEEMAAIEEASIGNAPPSDREEEMLSEIGELADFVSSNALLTHDNTAASQDTPTTAMESASQISEGIGFHSHRIVRSSNLNPPSNSSVTDVNDNLSAWQQSTEHLPLSSSQLLNSPGIASDHSVIANPPSVVGVEEEEEMILDHIVIETGSMIHGDNDPDVDDPTSHIRTNQIFDPVVIHSEDHVDRSRRSGFVGSLATPDVNMTNFAPPFSTLSNMDARLPQYFGESTDHSLGTGSVGENSFSVKRAAAPNGGYGSIEEGIGHGLNHGDGATKMDTSSHSGEGAPLLQDDGLSDMTTRQKHRQSSMNHDRNGTRSRFPSIINYDKSSMRLSFQPGVVVDSLFDEIRSLHDFEHSEGNQDSQLYLKSGTFKRGQLTGV